MATILAMDIEAISDIGVTIAAAEVVVAEEVAGGMRVETGTEIEIETAAEKSKERETIETPEEILEDLWYHSATIEAVIENGAVETVSKEGGLLLLLVEEDPLIIIVEIFVMRLQAWTWTVLAEAHETVQCLLPHLRQNHPNHLFMVTVEPGATEPDVVAVDPTMMNTTIDPRSVVDLPNPTSLAGRSLLLVSLQFFPIFT